MPQTADVIELPVPHPPVDRPAARDRPRRPWPGYVLVVSGVALLPWLVVLATGLPTTATAPHWTVAWVGLDAMEAAGLMATGLLTLRGSAHRAPVAAATAMLLVCDAWFDTTTASGSGFGTAVLMAAGAELPLAAVCAVLAFRAARGPLVRQRSAAGTAADRDGRRVGDGGARDGRAWDGAEDRPMAGVTVLPSGRNATRAPSVPPQYRPSPRGV